MAKTKATTKKVKNKKNVRKRKTQKKSFLKMKIIFGFICMIFVCLFSFILYCYLTLPDINEAVSRTRSPSTTIIAENGNEISTYGSNYSKVVYLNDLPYYVPAAIIDVEDRRFYSHFGFDVIGFARASIINIIKRKYAQGASTITQQVAKNLFLTPKYTLFK